MKIKFTLASACLLFFSNVSAQITDNSFGLNGSIALPYKNSTSSSIKSIAEQTNHKIVALANGFNSFVTIRFNHAGSIDTSFGYAGYVEQIFDSSLTQSPAKVLIQSDNKILVIGTAGESPSNPDNKEDFVVARYNPDGSKDLSFNGIGYTRININHRDHCNDAALQADGKIVLCGDSGYPDSVSILRLNPDGTLDNSFNGTGKFINKYGEFSESLNSVSITADDKIVACGQTNIAGELKFLLLQLNSDGTLDKAFGKDGVVITSLGNAGGFAHDLEIQQDGKIVIGGRTVNSGNNMTGLLVRYMPDGSLDHSFGAQGKVSIVSPLGLVGTEQIEIDNKGKIYSAGHIVDNANKEDMFLIRHNSDGSVDEKYSTGGLVTKLSAQNERTHAMLIDADGKILTGGFVKNDTDNYSYLSMTRFLPWSLNIPSQSKPSKELIEIFPNPSSNHITVSIPKQSENCTFSISDGFGHILIRGKISEENNQIDVSNLPSGAYILNTNISPYQSQTSTPFLKI